MKKYIIFIAVVISLAIGAIDFSKINANAVSTPYAVIGEDVWMLNENGIKIFLLPETYYARIDRMDDDYYHITFNGVSGKVPKSSVSVVGYDKTVTDTQSILRIASEYSVFTEIKMKTSLEGEAEEITAPTSEPLTYIGTFKQGENIWYYVSYAGQYGYVLNTYTDKPEMEIADFVPEKEETQEEKEPKEEEKNEPKLIKVLIIGGVSVVALIFVIVLFVPRKNKKHKYYYS